MQSHDDLIKAYEVNLSRESATFMTAIECLVTNTKDEHIHIPYVNPYASKASKSTRFHGNVETGDACKQERILGLTSEYLCITGFTTVLFRWDSFRDNKVIKVQPVDKIHSHISCISVEQPLHYLNL